MQQRDEGSVLTFPFWKDTSTGIDESTAFRGIDEKTLNAILGAVEGHFQERTGERKLKFQFDGRVEVGVDDNREVSCQRATESRGAGSLLHNIKETCEVEYSWQ